ncbi:unnamed protein product [Polarella glacialis]|uniref:Anaphase-promoting complex subunit 5 n=1 Tax=Polarella glacialis TaxID=89957 RepID=A0A813GGH4_POLGL|nr:unnamed protein product [Polarella glacialis]
MALHLLMGMSEVAVLLTSMAYNAAIAVCARHEQWLLALSLLRQMQEASAAADTTSCQCVITACDKVGHFELTTSLLDELEASLLFSR